MDDVAATWRRAGTSRSVAKSEDRRRDYQSANRARNRSESTADLFDNSKAPRQPADEDEGPIEVVVNGGARRVTSHDTSAVNSPLGERASPRKHEKQKEQRGNDTLERSARPSEDHPQDFAWRLGNASRVETPSPILKSVFLEPMQTRGKIEAYIDAVYEQAVRERAKAASEKREEDERSEDSSDERDHAGDLGDSRGGSAESGRRIVDRTINNGRSLVRGESITSESITRSESERKGVHGIDEEDRRYLEL